MEMSLYGYRKMKTLIEYAISCGNDSPFPFKNEKWFGFTNENPSSNGNGNETQTGNETKNEPENLCRNEPTLHTKWGTAKINRYGYYRITSGVEGNNMKFLHRLIYEEYHKCTLLPQGQIHHIDNNRTNNCILNLELVSAENHLTQHNLDRNSTGYYRVSKTKCSHCKQGFIYRYQYYENDVKKALFSTSLKKLEEKVKSKKLPWRKLQ